MRHRGPSLGGIAVVVLAACGNITRKAGPGDAGMHDAAAVVDVTTVDAYVLPPPGEARELVPAAGRLTSATYTFDVQVGHPAEQLPAAGATYALEGNAAVKR